ncbi:MAG TPA: hypothetical protein VER37_01945, partial [Thermomicrobiales bacterium]|nr:hypothetical protein [Thermomicrobiales bacterium]
VADERDQERQDGVLRPVGVASVPESVEPRAWTALDARAFLEGVDANPDGPLGRTLTHDEGGGALPRRDHGVPPGDPASPSPTPGGADD